MCGRAFNLNGPHDESFSPTLGVACEKKDIRERMLDGLAKPEATLAVCQQVIAQGIGKRWQSTKTGQDSSSRNFRYEHGSRGDSVVCSQDHRVKRSMVARDRLGG